MFLITIKAHNKFLVLKKKKNIDEASCTIYIKRKISRLLKVFGQQR